MSALFLPDAMPALQLIVAVTLAASGGLKLADRTRFYWIVQQWKIFPSYLSRVMSYLLPGTEIALGGLLITSSLLDMHLFAAEAALILLSIFAGVQAAFLWKKFHPECGCLGRHRRSYVGLSSLARVGALWVITGAVVIWQ
jgi:hypothetical protein